jgi:hypothetical protein
MNSVQEIRELLLQSLEGGQFHAREKIKHDGTLAYADFLSIGMALKSCFIQPEKHNELIERLRPHIDVIIGVLPPGIQSQGLLPMPEDLTDASFKTLKLHEISDDQLRKWIIDDASLVYGELDGEELQNYFAELSPLIQPGAQFVDLGSGLGKVVMSAGLHFPFASCTGIEIVPYRHSMALARFQSLLKLAQDSLNQLQVSVTSEDQIPIPWTSELRVSHLLELPKRVSFQVGNMFTCDVSNASLVFIYSTCFGSFMQELAHKLANEAPEGCLVTTTTFKMDHPGLTLIKFLPAKTVAWTDIFVYKRTGAGPWPALPKLPAHKPNLEEWESKAWDLLSGKN